MLSCVTTCNSCEGLDDFSPEKILIVHFLRNVRSYLLRCHGFAKISKSLLHLSKSKPETFLRWADLDFELSSFLSNSIPLHMIYPPRKGSSWFYGKSGKRSNAKENICKLNKILTGFYVILFHAATLQYRRRSVAVGNPKKERKMKQKQVRWGKLKMQTLITKKQLLVFLSLWLLHGIL